MLSSLIWNPPSMRPCFPWKHVLKPILGEEYLTGCSLSYLSLISPPPIFSLFSVRKSIALFGFTLFIAAWSVTLFPIFIYINSFKDCYLTVKWDPCSLTGDYNTDCGTDMINSNKCARPFQFCQYFPSVCSFQFSCISDAKNVSSKLYWSSLCLIYSWSLFSLTGSLLCIECACCVAVSSINALICLFPNSISRIYFLPLRGFLYILPLSAGITKKFSISSLSSFPCFSSQLKLFISFLSFLICFY